MFKPVYDNKGLTLSLNEHVRPQYLSCDFCSSTVDFIGKVETFADDYAFVAGKIGAQVNTNLANNYALKVGIYDSSGHLGRV